VARPAVVAGFVLIAAGAAAIAFGVTRQVEGGMAPEAKAKMVDAVSRLDAAVGELRATVETRAKSFADNERVRELDTTDMDTIKDMIKNGDPFKVSAAAGEVLAIARALPDHEHAETIVTLPAGSAVRDLHAGKPGVYAALVGAKLDITAVSAVEFLEQRADLKGKTGFVAVTRELDVPPALAPLVDAHVDGELAVGASAIPIGAGVGSATATPMPLRSFDIIQLRYVDPPPVAPAIAKPAIAGGAGGAVLGLVLVVVGMMGGRRATGAGTGAESALVTTGFATPDARTQLGAAQPATATGGGPPAIPSSSTAHAMPGQMIGRWEVVRRLGSGGMADVYLARARGEAGFEKLVALKVMHPHLARNERAVEHFLDEARLAANVQHPNVVAIQDLGRIGDDYAIVMEYVDGVDLEKLLVSARTGERPVPVAVGLGILCRICDGLQAAHVATGSDGTPLGIIHRDVKSANVLVSKQGSVKVVDFGIAKAATQSHLTIQGETKGTPSMMAPEQRVGEQVDVRADVYSVAAVGFEVMTNHGVNLDLAALAHLGVDNWPHLPLPSTLRPELPTDLDAVLLGAMAFERDRRPASCDALEQNFAAVMKAHGLVASDKDIARWAESELVHIANAPPRASAPAISERPTSTTGLSS
jgi:serine/threonine-protein kinase